MSPVLGVLSVVLGGVIMLAVPGYLILQVWAPMKLAGGWRTAALAPLAPALPIFVWCAYAFADQSNLWPIPFIMFAPFATGYLALIVAIGRKETGKALNA